MTTGQYQALVEEQLSTPIPAPSVHPPTDFLGSEEVNKLAASQKQAQATALNILKLLPRHQ